jgi:hypothetical protein
MALDEGRESQTGELPVMPAQIAPFSSHERSNEDDSIAIVAGELVAQLGAAALEVVEGWEAAYMTPFWRKVIDEIRRTARRDRC